MTTFNQSDSIMTREFYYFDFLRYRLRCKRSMVQLAHQNLAVIGIDI